MVTNQDAAASVLEEVQQCVVRFQDVANTKRRNKKSFSFDSLKYRHIGISRKSNERFYTNYATKQYTKGL